MRAGVYNGRVKMNARQAPPTALRLDPVVLGTAYCIASAIGYTATNICLRQLTTLGTDPAWVICIKETVTVAVVGPWLAWQVFRGHKVFPAGRMLLVLLVTGLAVQLLGNLPQLWAFGVVGIAVSVPAIYGVMLIASALLGAVLLKEAVTRRSAVAICFLICSIALLSVGVTSRGAVDYRARAPSGHGATAHVAADHAAIDPLGETESPRLSPLWVILGVGASCLAGAMFAMFSITIRSAVTLNVPVPSILVIITGMGVLSLGALSLWHVGPVAMLETPPNQFAWMLAAGLCNLGAFLAITKGLQLTTVVHANVLNASQVAMGAMAGVILFHESLDALSLLGVALTIVGIILFRQPQTEEPEVPGA